MPEGMGNVNSIDQIGWIIWTKDGPTLHPNIAVEGQRFTGNQRETINQVLRDAHQAYVKLEQETIHRAKNESGHWVTTVKIEDEGKLAELEDQVWTGLDAIVNLAWQKEMRSNLNLRRPGDAAILGFAERHGAIEIWKVGSWYHWKIGAIKNQPGLNGPPSDRVQGSEYSGPQLPFRYQRFWTEPVTTEEDSSR